MATKQIKIKDPQIIEAIIDGESLTCSLVYRVEKDNGQELYQKRITIDDPTNKEKKDIQKVLDLLLKKIDI